MSETGVGASSTSQEGRITAGVRREQEELEPLVRFAREQPFTTVFLALGSVTSSASFFESRVP
jgi:hypothetical protein